MSPRLILAASLLCAPAAHAAPVSPGCPLPMQEVPDPGTLPRLAEVLRPGATVNILAIGAAADAKTLAAAQTGGFFAQLSRALEGAVPKLGVAITVRGGRGLSAPAQVQLLRTALQQHAYQLVLWQTGTVDAVQDEPPETFYQALQDGADVVAAANADLVMVEPQYSRFLEANADVSPYLSTMQAVGTSAGRLVFHRYGLMHTWEDAGLIDLEHAARRDRPAVSSQLHACLANELARALLAGARR